MPEFAALLDEGALEALIERARSLPGDPAIPDVEACYRVDTPDGPVRHRQTFVDGRLIAWNHTRSNDRPEFVHDSVEDSMLFGLGLLKGPEGCSATRIGVAAPGRAIELPCPPSHLARAAGLEIGPRIPNADVTVQLHVRETPFGPLDYWMEFSKAQLNTWQWGVHPAPEVSLDPTLRQIVDFHSEKASLVDLVSGAQLNSADWTYAMLAGGILDSREFHSIWRGHWHAETGQLLVALGQVMAGEPVRQLRRFALELVCGD